MPLSLAALVQPPSQRRGQGQGGRGQSLPAGGRGEARLGAVVKRDEERGRAPHLTEFDSHGTAPDLAAPAATALAAPAAAALAASLPLLPPLHTRREPPPPQIR